MHEGSAFSPTTHDEIAEHIRRLEGCGPETYVESFDAGAHNFVLRGYNGPPGFRDFVVRYPQHPAHDTALRKDVRVSALVGDLAPRTWYCGQLPSGPIFVAQELVSGKPKPFNTLNDNEISTLASAISEVHAIASDRFSGRSGEEPSCCGTYEDYVWAMIYESVHVRLGRFDVGSYSEAIELLGIGLRFLPDLLDEQADEFRQPDRSLGLQHHDLNYENALWCPNGTLKIIDWNPTFGDPADELAYIFTDNHCSSAFIETFLQHYRPPAGSGDVVARIPVYVLKNLLDDMAWTIEMRELHPKEEKWITAYHERLVNLTNYLQRNSR